jgi:DNA-directed RNA polymerase specialized sigma24 family protein
LAIELPYRDVEGRIMSSFVYECPTIGSDAFFHHATGEEVREVFREHKEELAWLAVFLTGGAELAKVCLVDAFALATAPSDVVAESLERWTRCCTIRSAIEMRQSRISLLASIYERTSCGPWNHAPLSPVLLDLLYDNPEELGLRLDVLCRAGLVLCGVEGYSSTDSALLLGVSRTAVEAAYCTALAFLEVLSCKMLVDSGADAKPCC